MSNRINGLIIALDKDYREEDIESLKNAIMQLKGVISVKENIVSPDSFIISERIKSETREKIYNLYKVL